MFVIDVRQRVSIKPAPAGSAKPAVSGKSPHKKFTNKWFHLVTPSNIGTLERVNPQTPSRDGPNGLTGGTPGKLPRAILPPQRTFWGAILDVIVGDGPSKR